jgi:hypothetical protein
MTRGRRKRAGAQIGLCQNRLVDPLALRSPTTNPRRPLPTETVKTKASTPYCIDAPEGVKPDPCRRTKPPAGSSDDIQPTRGREGHAPLFYGNRPGDCLSYTTCKSSSLFAPRCWKTGNRAMYKACPDCEYFTEDASTTTCPECGSGLQLTMLRPARVGGGGAGAEPGDDDELVAPRTEALELPAAVRLTQIGAGIFIFFAVSRWGTRILSLLIGPDAEVTSQGQVVYLFVYTAFLYVAASLTGGAVAGAWSVNWVPQGIGVGLGVLAIPLILLILFLPESMPLYLVGVLVTTGLTVLGAYIGHRLVRPSQYYS